MLTRTPLAPVSKLRQAVRDAYCADEGEILKERIAQAAISPAEKDRIGLKAGHLVRKVREDRMKSSGIDAFMHEYELSSEEGVVLMCLAEALLRIPDNQTMDELISDRIGGANWESHLGHSESSFVNASTWALMLTGRIVEMGQKSRHVLKDRLLNLGQADTESGWKSVLKKVVYRSGEPVIRQAVKQAMKILGRQFVMGRHMGEALKRAGEKEKIGYRYSYDMLGEAARTMKDAEKYYQEYANAIHAIGKEAKGRGVFEAPGVSVKLSALHPRYEFGHKERVMAELLPRIIELCHLAAQYDIGLCIDAEEADRLDLSMDILEAICEEQSLNHWQGLGLAIQAYQKRCAPYVDWLTDLGRRTGRRFMVRLVKGAYWDTEIKLAQELGLEDYPVFTQKHNTDVSYLACARKLLAADDAFYPCFASHNAHTVAAIMEMARVNDTETKSFEFQCLHGMGDALYDQVVGKEQQAGRYPVRIYAPVGSHEDLLAYLVRRLLENGANSSFVNRIVDEKAPIAEIIADPIHKAEQQKSARHEAIALPKDLYGATRANSQGYDLRRPDVVATLSTEMMQYVTHDWAAAPLIGGKDRQDKGATEHQVINPAQHAEKLGYVTYATADQAKDALDRAYRAHFEWDKVPASERQHILNKAADLFEENAARLMAIIVKEAGKSPLDAIAELREAVDFLRYYGVRAAQEFSKPEDLPGPTGEYNRIMLSGRGVFLCISPWNFPLAIFAGQVCAALAAGNGVLAKPAEQTSIIAYEAVKLLHQAGIPAEALQLLPGDGALIAGAVLLDPKLGGVAFTGSTETARLINRTLAERPFANPVGAMIPLIAETGGQNAMIVDSSALPEQVTRDVLISAFQSAGQRCSALRILCLQEDIADKQIEMIKGAMKELEMGDPAHLSTDVGPVIDAQAKNVLDAHIKKMTVESQLLEGNFMPAACDQGSFVAPHLFELQNINQLEREVFGPILHVVRYKASELDQLLQQINATGYGLTLSIHSRIEEKVRYICERVRVGNMYVNRNQIGAIVGVQPFGGEGLSGTGPKAGGPRYLHRFAVERTISTDTTAAGGNASLMSL